MKITDKVWFRLRHVYNLSPSLRRLWWQVQGAQFGSGTRVPRMYVSWPHQLSLGRDCRLEDGIAFKFDGVWKPGPSILIGDNVFVGGGCEFNIRKRIVIKENSLIASGCKFIDHDHGSALDKLMRQQECPEAEIVIEDNVWLGVNVVVLKGVTIGSGAIVAAGAIVNKSIGPNEVWAGIPARKIKERS